ncbi:PREDICTED: S-adenosylmethionine mitochondrial carrier protein-like [Amphimedon queenslandica]|uniref:S-adenosylmethionine mitochondrial carrier protein n=2 Tax=Amphimedon queenslandica TaxID=400682 RepID=A0AAN0I984_AMPQE|nr:PREDICTED: S-adenosylmethionine mitochondrial carrier protein-like [Amphimedon queenslandica]|eukprot:XP_003382993.1 PREDICTED: S-adenosylmethionine mitochondrial carrier protein-like [Amphimedon queenslandica]
MKMATEAKAGDVFNQFLLPLMSGGIAGTTGDIVLFPLDTIKTRLQSKRGFLASGGFRNIYSGILPAAVSSAPSAATFFCTYEIVKHFSSRYLGLSQSPFVHMAAASIGEMVSLLVRVPFEIVKQRMQTNKMLKSSQIIRQTLATEGILGLYRGYWSTVIRDVPFSFIQYPLWEYFKHCWSVSQESPVLPWQGAVCGALAGSVAASVTTPLDVAKTRIMLAKKDSKEVSISIYRLVLSIGREEGIRGLFAGFTPRVTWIGIGGFVFLGAYEKSKYILYHWYNGPPKAS